VNEIKIHPACDLFPSMSEEDFQELKANIAEHGVRDFVTFWQGQLVDGRHRVRAMQELGIDVACHSSELFDDDDPFAFAISVNLKRRHLTTSQRAMIASKLATLLHGTNQFDEKVDARIQASTTTQEKAAEALNVGRSSIQEARKLERNAAPEVAAAVHAGTVTLGSAWCSSWNDCQQAGDAATWDKSVRGESGRLK
jgi:ParB-like chromosome segregation protein Spo0J